MKKEKKTQETELTQQQDNGIQYSSNELNELLKRGMIPEALGKHALEELEKSFEDFIATKHLREKGASQEEWIDWYEKNGKPKTLRDMQKSTELIEFLVKNKEKLLGIFSLVEEKKFRQSREIIDNKLDRKKEDKDQLTLFDYIEENKKDKTTLPSPDGGMTPIIKGLELSTSEDKLVHTLCLLLSKKSERFNQSSKKYYMGNYTPGLLSINDIEIETARMIISPHELYSTYLGRKDYNTDHIKFILNTLNDLSKKNFLITLNLPSQSSSGDKKKIDKFRTYLPLFQIGILNLDLTESESQEIDKNEALIEGKKCHLLFKFGPLFTNNIRDRYVEFPEDIHLRIANSKASGAKGRIPQCVNLMRDLLFREKQQNRFSIERDEETLVHILGLSKEMDAGKKGRIQERLNKSFEIFLELGLLKNVTKTTGSRGQTKYQIEINRDFQ